MIARTVPIGRLAASVNRWWWPAAGAAVAVTWVAVAVANSARVPPLAAAAAAGTAALAAAPALPVAGVPGIAGVLAVFALPVAVAEAARGGNAAPLAGIIGVIVLAAVVSAGRERGPSTSLVALSIGVTAVVTGLAAGSLESDQVRFAVGDRPAAAVVLAGAALVFAAVDDRMISERAVFAPVLLGALLAVPALPSLAVALAWGALAVAAAAIGKPSTALAAAAVVAAAAGVLPAALLLGAAAVLAAALDSRLAAVCALPGAIVLADALASRSLTSVAVVTGLVLAGTAAGLGLSLRSGLRIDGGRAVGLALAAWLVVAPGTWGFTGAETLDAYDVGAARAVAVGALIALAVTFRRGAELADGHTGVPPPENEDDDLLAARPAVTTMVAAAATVASVAWLVVSVVRLH